MQVRVLGSAVEGGFPQWNCGCPNCLGVRRQSSPPASRMQSCLAVSRDGDLWFLIGASPDIPTQIESFPPSIRGQAGIRRSLASCSNNGDVDQCLGLLSLREAQPLHV